METKPRLPIIWLHGLDRTCCSFWDRLLGWTLPLLGGSFRARGWHHLVAWLIVAFVVLHLYIVLYDTKLYKNGLVDSMLSGYNYAKPGDHERDR